MSYEKTFQRILVKGRLATDINFKIVNNATPVSNFAIIINDGNNNDFIPVVAWGNKAKIINDYAEKGDLILFEGRIRSSSYESEEKGKILSLKLQVLNDTENNKALLQIEKKKLQDKNKDENLNEQG